MRLLRVETPEFDLARTLESGQVFHWQREGIRWSGLIDSTPVCVEQGNGGDLRVPSGTETLLRHYFAFDHPLDAIYASFPTDPVMRDALAFSRGLRIIRQPVWECLGTFITSPMKRVEHIRQMSLALRERFGEPVEGSVVRRYPVPAALAACKEGDFRECGLGFRAKNLLAAARMVADGAIDLEAIHGMETDAAREVLCRIPGVGRKVANCVLLFAYERLDAVPVDVWIGRILRNEYLRGVPKLNSVRIEAFSAEHFGVFAGYAQQYLFHHARVRSLRPAS